MYNDFIGWDPIKAVNRYLKSVDNYLENINKFVRVHSKGEIEQYLKHYEEEVDKVLSKKKK